MSAPAALAAPAPPSPRPARPRLAALDAARALGVLAMVMGHTLDAVLSPEARQTPAMISYWHARGFTAPLFLLVSGWAVTLAISRSGARGWEVPRGRLRRVLLLLGVGYLLRWPGWALDRLLAGDREIWAKFLAFDALHCIAVALLVTSLVLALPWRDAWRAALLAGLGAAAVLLGSGAFTPGEGQATVAALPRALPAMALAQVAGGTSDFPVFPWATYFFAGTLVGLLAPAGRRGPLAMAAVGAALVAVGLHAGGLGSRSAGDPVLIAFRIGVVVALLAALSLVPPGLAARAAPLGKSSLGVYALHIPIVYGWSAHPGLAWYVGKTLGPGAGVAIAGAVLLVSFALYRVGAVALRRAAAWARNAIPRASAQ